MRIGVKPGQYGWSFDELVASWEVAETVGFDVLACFDHVSSSPHGDRAWDAPTLLGTKEPATHLRFRSWAPGDSNPEPAD
jgi:hypothetical protein